ncbi:purine/pyrimidine permease [bacterium]|nr:purine/pyrimidine permease [bacterium]
MALYSKNDNELHHSESSADNIYQLDGRVPLATAIPFGLQHVLAMFTANITPIILIAGVAKYRGQSFAPTDTALLIQAAMLVAGIGTLIQLYPVLHRIGARLPIVMGMSFTFLAPAITLAERDYGLLVGASIVGGCLEGVLGLSARYWRRYISPIVSACVVIAIGISLIGAAMTSFVGGNAQDAGSWPHLAVATITLLSCLLFYRFVKGTWRHLYVLFGLAVGYITALVFSLCGISNMIDPATIRSTINELGIISLPHICHFTPQFEWGAIISIALVSLVSAAETIGDTTAVCQGGLKRDITEQEISGSLSCDGFMSAVSAGIFGCTPITSFSQNVGLVTMTKVVNRFTIMCGTSVLILAGLFPPIGALLSTIPPCVLGGCTVIMFGAIIVAGLEMASKCGFGHHATQILAISLCVGIGSTQSPALFSQAPELVSDIFAKNPVAGVFVTALLLSWLIPKDSEEE